MTSNALVDEANRKHAEHAARAAAVAGAKSPDEAYRLGAAHAAAAQAASDNRAAYLRGVASVNTPPVVAKSAPPAAPSPKAPQASRGEPAAKGVAAKLGAGDVALRARAYIVQQEKLGRRVSTAEAVSHITNTL
jgi:hypothetical protein